MLISRRLFSNYFSYGSHSIVGPGKKKGEDAFYTAKDLLSIADGVGGWTLYGIDPSKYAWELMRAVEKFSFSLEGPDRNSNNILTKAASICTETGSSTCSLTLLDKINPVLDTINIGDSGFYIYRRAENRLELVDKSKEVLHGFNFPFQLGTDGDKVDSAWKKAIEVKDKDYIVMFTDGVCDNLYEEMVREIMIGSTESDLNLVAKRIAEKALERCADEKYFSPFSKNASETYGKRYTGGKPDDITVIVAQINIEKTETN